MIWISSFGQVAFMIIKLNKVGSFQKEIVWMDIVLVLSGQQFFPPRLFCIICYIMKQKKEVKSAVKTGKKFVVENFRLLFQSIYEGSS